MTVKLRKNPISKGQLRQKLTMLSMRSSSMPGGKKTMFMVLPCNEHGKLLLDPQEALKLFEEKFFFKLPNGATFSIA